MWLFKGLSKEALGIDLGTSNLVVYAQGQGIVVEEPNLVAVSKRAHGAKELIAYGLEAKAMEGKTPMGVSIIHPLRDGVIANYEMTEAVMRYAIGKVMGKKSFNSKPDVVVSVPSKVTEVERRAVIDAALGAGAREAYLIDEPIAAAMGANLPIREALGSMVVDIGGGISEVAVISLGGIVVTNNIREAGDNMDLAIVNAFRQRHELVIGERTAEMVKIELGSLLPDAMDTMTLEVKGRDTSDGLPKSVMVTPLEVREALQPIVTRIEEAIRMTLEETPPELARDVLEQGITLTGGAAQLRGLSEYLSARLGTPVYLAEDPLRAVALGVGYIAEHLEECKSLLTTVRKRVR